MRKHLSALLVTMLCACCLGLIACGDSGSSSSAASDSASSAAESASAPESSSAAESESSSAAADPSEQFIGDWKLAGMELNDVTVIGDLSAVGGGTASLSIVDNGTGTLALDDDSGTFTWKQADDASLTITPDQDGEDAAFNGTATAVYQDGTVRVILENDGQSGTLIFSKDGTIEGLEPLSTDDATDITSEEALIGTWKVSAATMEGATMYGDSASLAAMNGSEEMIITFEEGGKATVLGSDAAWSVDDKGAVINDPTGVSIAVKALGDDIIINIGEIYGANMYLRFSK